jgi:hypothetical protein
MLVESEGVITVIHVFPVFFQKHSGFYWNCMSLTTKTFSQEHLQLWQQHSPVQVLYKNWNQKLVESAANPRLSVTVTIKNNRKHAESKNNRFHANACLQVKDDVWLLYMSLIECCSHCGYCEISSMSTQQEHKNSTSEVHFKSIFAC